MFSNFLDYINNNIGFTISIVVGVTLINYGIYYLCTKNSLPLDNSSSLDSHSLSGESTVTQGNSTCEGSVSTITSSCPSLDPITINTKLFHELVRELKIRELREKVDFTEYGLTVDDVRYIVSKFDVTTLQNETVN
jgi:hypothetical protein